MLLMVAVVYGLNGDAADGSGGLWKIIEVNNKLGN